MSKKQSEKQATSQTRIWIGRPIWQRLGRMARKKKTPLWSLATKYIREGLKRDNARQDGR